MTTSDLPDSPILLTEAQVSELTQIPQRTIRMMFSAGRFPKPIRLGKGQVKARKRWLRSEVEKWVADLVEERDKKVD
jgi:predicted DNA-binding transcriptional regulator AlpA